MTFVGDMGYSVNLKESIEEINVRKLSEYLQTGIDVNSVVCDDGSTALHFSVHVLPEVDCFTISEVLLAYGANPNLPNKDGESSLHIAASKGYCQVLNLFLVNGGDPLLGDLGGSSSIDVAFQHGHVDAVHVLSELLNSESYESLQEKTSNVVISLLKEELIEVFGAPEVSRPSSQESDFSSSTYIGDMQRAAFRLSNSSDSSIHKCSDDVSGRNEKLQQEMTCCIDKDSDHRELVASQKYLRQDLCGCSTLFCQSKSRDVCLDNSSLEPSQSDFNIACSPLEISLDESYTHFPFDDSDIPGVHGSKANICNSDPPGIVKKEQNSTYSDSVDLFKSFSKQLHMDFVNLSDMYFSVQKMEDVSEMTSFDMSSLVFCNSSQLIKTHEGSNEMSYLNSHDGGINLNTILESYKAYSRVDDNLSRLSCSIMNQSDNIDANETAPQNTTLPEFITSFHLLKAPKKATKFLHAQNLNEFDYVSKRSFEGAPNKHVGCLIPKEHFNSSDEVDSSKVITTEKVSGREEHLECGKAKSFDSRGSQCSCESVVSIVKEFLYEDKDEGISLIERRGPSILTISSHSVTKSSWSSATDDFMGKRYPAKDNSTEAETRADQSLDSFGTLTDSVRCIKGDHLFKSLQDIGFAPGPILPSTERLYQRHLMRLRKHPEKIASEDFADLVSYPHELERALRNPTSIDVDVHNALEQSMSLPFSEPDPSRYWRDGTNKTCFNYLLLDPRCTEDLPVRGILMTEAERFRNFISAIFYVGKGTRCRPYYHLYEAFKAKEKDAKINPKSKRIQEIWSEGVGVVSLHIFQNTIPVEAWTREASIISAIGLKNLCNTVRGTFYGVASTWKATDQRRLGTHLLFRALNIFMQEGERQLRPSDVTLPTWMKKK